MRPNPSLYALLLLALALGAGTAPAGAQSLLSSRGLGFVLEPLDARARALGGVGLGLPGYTLSLVNPAGSAGLPAPALLVAFQPDWYSGRVPGAESDGSTARFPLIHAAFPVGERWTATVGYGAFLDQNWAAERRDTLRFGGRELPVLDRFTSQGGVGRFRAGASYGITERLAVGVAADLYTGAVRDTLSRFFVRDSVQTDPLLPSAQGREWTYRGVGGSAGVRWTPVDALSLAASVSAAGRLETEPVGDSTAVGKDFPLPVMVHAGGSARVTPGATVALAADWAGWSVADESLAGVGGARDAWKVAGGVEWDTPSREGRATFPLRVGARYATLPFRWGSVEQGSAFPTERAVTAGIGARLAGGAALADLAAERGRRGSEEAALEESYWRLTLSLTLLGR